MRVKMWFIIFLITLFCISSCNVEHIHAAVDNDDCYTGTKHTHAGNSSTYGGCYTGAATEVRGACNGYCGSSRQYGCEACGSWAAGGSTCAQCGSTDTNSWLNYYCSTCGYAGLDYGHYTTVIGYTYALSCGKTEGVYYNDDGSVSENISHLVVTSLVPAATVQSITVGGSVNATATATFLDGHTETVTCAVSGFNPNTYSTAQTVTLSYGSYCDSAKNAYSKTATVSVTVNGYFDLSITKNISSAGTVTSGGSKLAGSSITVSASPSAGYTFNGWYNGSTLLSSNTSYTFTMPASAYSLEARFTANTYTLTVNANGGTINEYTPYTLTFGTGNYCDISWLRPVRTGYTFAGWYTASSGGSMVYNSDGVVVNEGTYWRNTLYAYAGNLTVYAQWTANTYTVTFDTTGGTASPSSKTVTYTEAYGTLPTPTRTGYIFSDWCYGGAIITSSSTVAVTENHTLTATWTPRTDIVYTVNHHVERDGEYRLYETNEYIGTADATVHINGLQTVYKEFDYKEGRVNDTVATTATISPDGSLVINLYYDRKNPIVTFYSLYTDGFIVSMKPSVMISEKKASGGYEITAGFPDEDVYAREDNKLCVYRFIGWLTEDGETISSFADITEDMVLYAQYELVPYLNPNSDTADADTTLQGLRKAEAATAYADNTYRYLEYGNTLLEMDLAAFGAFDYVTAYYPWLDETRTIAYEDGILDDTGKWCYVDQVYGENAEVIYDNRKYLIEIKYYATLPEDEKMILATYGVNIIFVPYDEWKKEIVTGRWL